MVHMSELSGQARRPRPASSSRTTGPPRAPRRTPDSPPKLVWTSVAFAETRGSARRDRLHLLVQHRQVTGEHRHLGRVDRCVPAHFLPPGCSRRASRCTAFAAFCASLAAVQVACDVLVRRLRRTEDARLDPLGHRFETASDGPPGTHSARPPPDPSPCATGAADPAATGPCIGRLRLRARDRRTRRLGCLRHVLHQRVQAFSSSPACLTDGLQLALDSLWLDVPRRHRRPPGVQPADLAADSNDQPPHICPFLSDVCRGHDVPSANCDQRMTLHAGLLHSPFRCRISRSKSAHPDRSDGSPGSG